MATLAGYVRERSPTPNSRPSTLNISVQTLPMQSAAASADDASFVNAIPRLAFAPHEG